MGRARKQRLPRRTDAGNAEFFAALFGHRLRFDHTRQRWLLYAQHWWTLDVDGELMRMAKQAARLRVTTSATIGDDEAHKNEAQWALRSESLPRLQAMLSLARSERPIADDGSHQWDGNNWALGVANGVVDSSQRQGRRVRRYCARVLPWTPQGSAACAYRAALYARLPTS